MKKRIILLTGVNRGIGRKTAELILQQKDNNFKCLLTLRDKKQMKQMQNHFNQFFQEFEILDLDISLEESRNQFIQKVQHKNTKIDVLINNAGVVDRRPTNKEIANFTFQTNFLQTVQFTETFINKNLLSDDAKILLISSNLGQLQLQPQEGQKILSDENITKNKLFDLAYEYINNSNNVESLIFNQKSYETSKAFLNAYGRFVLTKKLKQNQSVYIVHPGWVKTDMGGEQAEITLEEACPFIYQIACQFPFERNKLNGKFIYKNKEMDF